MIGTIIGIVISVLGIFASWIFAKWSLKRKVISNYTRNEFGIGKQLVTDFPDLKITFQNNEIKNDLRIYKGVLMNTGSKDISENNKNNKITVVLPEGCKIHAFNINNGKVDVDSVCSANKLDLIFGLLRSNECIGYDIIYEVESGEVAEIGKKIEFYHRIEDVEDKIKTGKLEPHIMGPLQYLTYSLWCLILLCTIGAYFSFFTTSSTYTLRSKVDGKEISLLKGNDSSFIANGIQFTFGNSGKKISPTELSQNYEITQKSCSPWILPLVFIIAIVLFLILIYSSNRDIKRIKYLEKNLGMKL